jgi:ribosomal protein L30/L7E
MLPNFPKVLILLLSTFSGFPAGFNPTIVKGTASSSSDVSETCTPVPKTMQQWMDNHDYERRDNPSIDEFKAQYELTSQEMGAIYWYKEMWITTDALTSGLLKIPPYIGTASRFLNLKKYPKVVQMLDDAIMTGKILKVKDLIEIKRGNGITVNSAMSSSPFYLNSKNRYKYGDTELRIESFTGRWISSADNSEKSFFWHHWRLVDSRFYERARRRQMAKFKPSTTCRSKAKSS